MTILKSLCSFIVCCCFHGYLQFYFHSDHLCDSERAELLRVYYLLTQSQSDRAELILLYYFLLLIQFEREGVDTINGRQKNQLHLFCDRLRLHVFLYLFIKKIVSSLEIQIKTCIYFVLLLESVD